MRYGMIALLAAMVAGSVVGCQTRPVPPDISPHSTTKQATVSARKTGPPKHGAQVGDIAFDFSASLDDVTWQLSSLRGKKGAVIVFFAAKSQACRRKTPALVQFHQQRAGDNLAVIAIDYRETDKDVAKFKAELGVRHGILIDREGLLHKLYDVENIPTVIGIDKNGIIRYRGHSLPEDHDAFVTMLTR